MMTLNKLIKNLIGVNKIMIKFGNFIPIINDTL